MKIHFYRMVKAEAEPELPSRCPHCKANLRVRDNLIQHGYRGDYELCRIGKSDGAACISDENTDGLADEGSGIEYPTGYECGQCREMIVGRRAGEECT